MLGKIIGISIIVFIVVMIFFAIRTLVSNLKRAHELIPLDAALDSLRLGMPEYEMLERIGRTYLGDDYDKSLLKNNRVKYEWRISNGISSGFYFKGFSTRAYSGVKKLDIYCKDGVVEEIRPYNL